MSGRKTGTPYLYSLKGDLLLNEAGFDAALEADKRENDSSQQSDDHHAYETTGYRVQSKYR